MKDPHFHPGLPTEALEEATALETAQLALKTAKENDRLKRALRYAFLTLGYYGTEYNYQQGPCGGVNEDGGRQARDANTMAHRLGFLQSEILGWKGPFGDKEPVSVEAKTVWELTCSTTSGP